MPRFEEASLAGKGSQIMLPARGSPFRPADRPDRPGAAESREGRKIDRMEDLSHLEPRDLTPEDLAALFPSEHEDREPPADLAMSDATAPGRESGPAAAPFAPPARLFGVAAAPAGPGPFGLGAPTGPKPAAEPAPTAAVPTPPSPGPAAVPRPPKPEAPPHAASTATQPAHPFAPAAGEVVFGMPVAAREAPAAPAAPPATLQPSPKPGAPAEPRLEVELGEGRHGEEKLPEAVEAREEMLRLLVDKDSLRALWKRTQEIERLVIMDTGGSQKFIRQSLDALERSRNLLLGGPDYYEDAEREISAVEAAVRLKGRQREWARYYGWRLFAFELTCLALLVVLYALAPRIVPLLVGTGLLDNGAARTLWTTILAGGLGAVTGGLYNLYVHVARDQDFDPQHLMWYLTNPVMGVVLGIFVYMIVAAGFLSLIGAGAGGGTQIDFRAQMTINLLAWLCGFQQNLAYDLVKKALNLVSPKKEEPPPAPVPVTPRPGS